MTRSWLFVIGAVGNPGFLLFGYFFGETRVRALPNVPSELATGIIIGVFMMYFVCGCCARIRSGQHQTAKLKPIYVRNRIVQVEGSAGVATVVFVLAAKELTVELFSVCQNVKASTTIGEKFSRRVAQAQLRCVVSWTESS